MVASRAMNAREIVAWNVRRLRVARDISAEVLAADAEIDRAYMSLIERGLGNPTIDMLEKLAAVLSVELADFFALPDPNEDRPRPLRPGRRKRT
jgi:transcriptional regulator with XRE-family HTH domain